MLRNWKDHEQLWACKNMELRHAPCPEARPFRPLTWCGECQKAAGIFHVDGARTVILSATAGRVEALERPMPPSTLTDRTLQTIHREAVAAIDVITAWRRYRSNPERVIEICEDRLRSIADMTDCEDSE